MLCPLAEVYFAKEYLPFPLGKFLSLSTLIAMIQKSILFPIMQVKQTLFILQLLAGI
jgi:hypothetical protein